MRLLAIETSCDETSVAVFEASLQGNASTLTGSFSVLAHFTASQAAQHAPYCGVYPTLAKREHTHNLPRLLAMAFSLPEASLSQPRAPDPPLAQWVQEVCRHEPPSFAAALLSLLAALPTPPVEGIVVTRGPGLDPALWVGVNAARVLARGWNIPLLGAHHLEGHLVSACVVPQAGSSAASSFLLPRLSFPLIGLIVSGGHTDLIALTSWRSRTILGRTRDDAAGEAFDKAARMLGLPYPGGPEIARLAQAARERDERIPTPLPRPMKESSSFDFSFAGLKTALRRQLQQAGFHPDKPSIPLHLQRAFAREVEEAIVETLLAKLSRACEATHARSAAVGGGVAANRYLQAQLRDWAQRRGIALSIVPPSIATDNALMVGMGASVDHFLHLLPPADPAHLRPDPNAPWPRVAQTSATHSFQG